MENPTRTKATSATRAVVLGLALVVGAATDQAVQLSNQVVRQLPAAHLLWVRDLIGAVGGLLLLWGLVGLLGLGRTEAVPPAPAEAGLPIPGEVVRQPAYEVGQPAVTPRPRLEMRARWF